MFSKEKVDKQTVIKLNLSAEQFTNILTELLNTINEDEILNSKLPETYKETLKNATQELEEDLKSETYSSEDNFEMRIYIEKRKAKKLEVKFLEGTSDNYYENGELKTAKRQTSVDETVDTTSDYYVHPAFTNETSIGFANRRLG